MGGGGSTSPTITQVANPTGVPLQDPLAGQGTRMLNEAAPFSYYGSGANLLPTANLGQTYLQGPNPTMYGNPTDASAATGSFGQVGSYTNPTSQYGGQAGGTNVPAGQTGNSSFGSIMNSLSGLFGGQGQQGGQMGPSPYGMGGPPSMQPGTGNTGASTGDIPTGTGASTGSSAGSSAAPASTQKSPTSSTPTSSTPSSSTSGTFSTTGTAGSQNPSTINPGTVLPNSQAGDNPVLSPQPTADQATRNSFLPSSLTAPFYNQAAVAGNLGTAAGQSVQPASNFMSSLFGPGLSQMSQDYLQAGTANAGINMQQGIGQLQQQYQNDPFNSALGRSEANLVSQTANNTLQTAAGMGVQQQQIAANQMATPFNLTAQNAATGVQDSQGLFNMANAQYGAPYSEPMGVYSQIPISSPVVTPGQTTQSK